MSEPRDWDVLAGFLAGEATRDEMQEIEAWMASDPENREIVERLKMTFSITAAADDVSNLNALWEEIAQGVARTASHGTRRNTMRGIAGWVSRLLAIRPAPALRWLVLPAAAAIALFALLWTPRQYVWKSPPMVELNVALGERLTVDLDDGTRVTLDAGSRLLYPERFEGESRAVVLRGEGYFQVTPDSSAPFVVTAGHSEIRVLGTAFNVRSWEDAKPVEVAVEDGRVRFGRAGNSADESVVLEAHQASSMRQGALPLPPKPVDIARQLAWLRDEAFYEDIALSEILDRLRRWHNVDFVMSDSALLSEHLTLHITKSHLENSLDLLARLTGSKVARIANTYHFTPGESQGI